MNINDRFLKYGYNCPFGCYSKFCLNITCDTCPTYIYFKYTVSLCEGVIKTLKMKKENNKDD